MEFFVGALVGSAMYLWGHTVGRKRGFAEGKRLYEPHPEWIDNPPKFEVSVEANLINPETGQTHVVKFP